MTFEPNYQNIVDAAHNRQAERLPLYEHGFDATVVEKIIGEPVIPLLQGTYAEKIEAYRRICKCGIKLGYDCIPFEKCVVELVQGGQGLMGGATGIIKNKGDIDRYPWDKKRDEYIQRFAEHFDAMREALPEGMKAVGGVGNGVFETFQDFVPFQELPFLQIDKPFLLHSCGKIYDVMDDIISVAGIDAKHSNEDAIDTFDIWAERYGSRIGNFGGVEMNIMTLSSPDEVKQYVRELLPKIEGHGGIAVGTGNQISDYTKPENWIAMTDAVREWRGD